MSILDTISEWKYFDKDSIALKVFETRPLFAAAAFNHQVVLNSVSQPLIFSLPGNYYFSDFVGSTPLFISIDGNSFCQQINPNGTSTFNSHGLGTGYHEVKISRGCQESPIATFFIKIIVLKHIPDYQMEYFSVVKCPNLDFSAGVGSGVVTFKINPLHQGKLMKPVIIVEGMDMKDIKIKLTTGEITGT